jgi:putative membrane protein
MVKLLLSWSALALAMWVATLFVPKMRVQGGAVSYFLIAALFTVLHLFVGWLLFVVIGVVTIGLGFALAFLTRLVVDAIVLKMVDALSGRLKIQSFGAAFLAALVMSLVGAAIDIVFPGLT